MRSTVQLRDAILQQQTLYNEAVRQSEIETEKVKQIVSSFSPDIVMQLTASGYDLGPVIGLDANRLLKDKAYLNEVMSIIQSLVDRLHTDLEDSLCIK